MKLLVGYSLLLMGLFSCQPQMQSQKGNFQMVPFDEINHVNLNLINSETKILSSQKEIDAIYQKINAVNPSPKKTPIPYFSEDETYVVVQPKIAKTDFMITEVSVNGADLKIIIQEDDNPEYKNQKYPVSIIMIHKNNTFKKIEIN